MSAVLLDARIASEYIAHHLNHLSTAYQKKIIDFSIFNIDTIFWSIFTGIFGCLIMYIAANKATSDIPSRFQAFIEIIIEMIENQSKSIIHNSNNREFISPLALTIFIWITLMNSLDFIPVDLFSFIFKLFGLEKLFPYHHIVPTADLNGTLGISFGILILILYYSIKTKGFFGFIYEIFSVPFGIWLAPFNLLLNIIEFLAKTISLGMRLFGNMYAGELLFLLIALLGSISTVFGFIGHTIIGSIWTIFHILIVLLQAFIFMMLTLVYIGQAHERH
ncbi:F0F1 ATP synthase subunit A [Candidatus Profftella armatura]|jgi:F0F1-type ATP synthase, subunit a|uniref:ATP synthase subunit a n=1 Tax=Candidatus Profftella armatura TaxID=669502 RepID=S5RLU9_9PROT|nr:F0F1 ATP synthase subunit A [Candidatus Profftella armatura]AGS06906.1 F0F1 ATP synthase subunit A [Candidatus Profftella armatura]ALC95988.1 ATP synthase F0F1 subunit A [Candidatus Profftella armatura]QLK13815.1 F0F1 ATP synthase subunit A [Candidatus Profftella armatura]